MAQTSRTTRFLARIGLLTILAVAIVVALAVFAWMRRTVPEATVLELDLEQTIVENPPEGLASLTLPQAVTLREVLDSLERARTDRRVKGILARVGDASHGVATVQELRDAVAAFRDAGKFAIAWADTFGESGSGNQAYYLATAFDEIWLQPSGDVGLTGLMVEMPFAREALDKLHVAARVDKRAEYKTAFNTFTETGLTPAHREELQMLADDVFGQIVRGVAASRGLKEAEVRSLCDRGPFLAREAVDARLVDRLAYYDDAVVEAKGRAGAEAELLDGDLYLERAGRPHAKGPTIALVYGVGAVVRGDSHSTPLFGGTTLGAATVAAAIRAAAKDDDVKAILFRVDSPGGSYVASDTIWRETVKARERGKPVVVSMGNVAGSGGYFVAMDAAKIVAEPGTITGSIGVLAGKPVTEAFWKELGVAWGEVHTSANAGMWSTTRDFTPYAWDRLEKSLDAVYRDFTSKVAAGRKMSLDKVLAVAKGRVWSGEAAKRLGLVDELGGFDTALRLAREAGGLAPDAEVTLEVFPRGRGLVDTLLRGKPENSQEEAAAKVDFAVLGRVARVLDVLAPADGPLRMPVPFVSP